jgi:lysophospholipase L1-like esterase
LNDGRVAGALVASPDVLIVAAGGNDSTISQGTWRELVQLARSRGVRVFWMGPPMSTDPDRDQTRRAITAALRETVQSAGGTFLDGRELARGLPYADTVHLTAVGYGQLAQRLASRVSSGPSLIGLAAAGLLAGGALAWWVRREASARATYERPRTRARR